MFITVPSIILIKPGSKVRGRWEGEETVGSEHSAKKQESEGHRC